MEKLKFIDLYSGLGGFHVGLSRLGHECVLACEIQEGLRRTYIKNFPNTPIVSDVLSIDGNRLPEFDIMCAGFPCQPFSRAGNRKGFHDERGNHFFKLIEIIKIKKPRFIFLENVETLLRHDDSQTFRVVQDLLNQANYDIKYSVLSPHEFNIPHHRRRIFIVGKDRQYGNLDYFNWPEKESQVKTVINYVDPEFNGLNGENLYLSNYKTQVVEFWNDFLENFPKSREFPSHPIWSQEWKANYPFKEFYDQEILLENLIGYRGAFGKTITEKRKIKDELDHLIPRYSFQLKNTPIMPKWKINFINKNRLFYKKNKDYINEFLKERPEVKGFFFSDQKLEWNCSGEERKLNDKLIQFRASGLRVKKATWIPTLNTINTQTIFFPIINRKLSVSELIKFQDFQELKYFPGIDVDKFIDNSGVLALGNAVNSKLVELIAKNLLR